MMYHISSYKDFWIFITVMCTQSPLIIHSGLRSTLSWSWLDSILKTFFPFVLKKNFFQNNKKKTCIQNKPNSMIICSRLQIYPPCRWNRLRRLKDSTSNCNRKLVSKGIVVMRWNSAFVWNNCSRNVWSKNRLQAIQVQETVIVTLKCLCNVR